MQKILDPHLHFFDLEKGKYTWLRPQNPPFWPDKHIISKDIMPSQLVLNSEFEFIGGVHIEAGFNNELSHRELYWLENDIYPIAPKYTFKSIAYADIKKPNFVFCNQLKKMLIYPTFKGIRYIIEENKPVLSELKQVVDNLKFLECAGILLEIQVSFSDAIQTRSLLSLISLVPKLKLVINHAGLPPLGCKESISGKSSVLNKDNKRSFSEFQEWKITLARFAQLPNCFIKCSGFEMQNRDYTRQHVLEIISLVHELFGRERLMLASNFPLTLFSTSYAAYWQLLYDCAVDAQLNCEHLMHLNAKNLYGF